MASAAAPAKTPTKRILVTGGSGFIGSHTVLELLQKDYEVVVVDNFCNSGPVSLERVTQLTGKRATVCLADLCNKDALDLVFEKNGPFDAVIHFAGLKAVGESVDLPLMYYNNNITGTLNLLAVMEKHKCYKLVFSSSATVYGAAAVPIPETAPLSATNAYGRTKLFIEQILQDVAASPVTGKLWKVIVLRYFNPVGAHPSGLIGEDPQGIPNNLMPYIAQVAVGSRPHLNVFGNDYDTPDGTGVRDYIHVSDLAQGHLAALENGLFSDKLVLNWDVFNLGRGQGYSVMQMLEAMGKACGRKLDFKMCARRPGDVGTSYADASKALRVLGWKADLGLDRMADDMWRWQKRNPKGFKGPLLDA